MTTTTFYPAIDGYASDTTTETYANIRAAAGDAASSGQSQSWASYLYGSPTTDKFQEFRRAIFSFDTSALTASATVSAAGFSIYATAKSNGEGAPAYGITGGTLVSNVAIAAGDFDGFASDRWASDIAYASVNTGARTTWTLNAAGIAGISLTSYTVIYLRDAWDIDNSFGGVWMDHTYTGVQMYGVASGDTNYEPALTVTYTTGGGGVQSEGTGTTTGWWY